LRRDAWPYLLELIPWDKDIDDYLPEWVERYKEEVKAWSELEAEVVKRDCEQFKLGKSKFYIQSNIFLARLRQSSNIDDYKFPPLRDNSTCSDVFSTDNTSPTTTNGEIERPQQEVY
jgi:hypothetical protein